MKKIQWTSLLVVGVITLSGCGTEEAIENQEEKKTETIETSTGASTETATTEGLEEPTEESTCAYCQMNVYVKGEDLGIFSAQGRTAEGENLFFDDVGCMLNQERMDGIVLEKYVRDYNTEEWILLEESIVVKAEIKTPMNYGYAFFKDEESAQAFIAETGKEHASLSSIADIDEVSGHRHIKRMEKMQNGSGMTGEKSHTHMSEEMNPEKDKSEE
jgi:hypothetical protein